MAPLLSYLEAEFDTDTDLPFAFFGHSMGALLCFEFARLLRRHGRPEPRHLFVSGYRAPQMGRTGASVHKLPDRELVEKLRRFNGTPAGVLDNPELIALFLPVLRADFAVVETYAYAPEAPLAAGITVFGGLRDEEAVQGCMEGWRVQTSGAFRTEVLAGDHFFLMTEQAALLRLIAGELGAMGV